ncbi:hypothetical protein BD410DRAFT_831277 [Rickenella mellea]|uniref:Uncharacterized protein n=1 Tax=Rickenella mellea TaxID=50990 RepID=A0A4Y7PR90_9AGAM|nr:hypothetical protein BD410DRAFT_831277 [Rickenella mellea]
MKMSTSTAYVNNENIPDGYYTIRNYGLGSLAALPPRRKELCGSVRASRENSFVWCITRRSHGKYQIKSHPNGLIVQCAPVPKADGPIYADRESFYWDIQQVSSVQPDCYLIFSSVKDRLVWSLADDEDGTPLVFAQFASNERFRWNFTKINDTEIEDVQKAKLLSTDSLNPYDEPISNSLFSSHLPSNINDTSTKQYHDFQSELHYEAPPFPAFLFGRDDFVTTAVHLILSKPPARLAILGPGGVDIQQQRPLSVLKDFLDTMPLALLVLDNFETIWESDQHNNLKLMKLQDSHKQLTILITMRGFLRPAVGDIRWTQPALEPLQVLTSDAAIQAFKAITPINDDTDLDKLVESVDCLPLAVVLLAHLGQMNISPSELLKMWLKEHTALLSANNGSKSACLETSISLSLQSPIMHQNQHALKLLKIICYLPAGVKNDNLYHIADITQLMTLKAVEALLKTGLVKPLKNGRWKVLLPAYGG